MINKAVDVYLVYSFIKRLVLPFTQWKAYKTGVIDAQGNILIPKDKRTLEQKDSFSSYDLMILNLKKVLAKVPGGGSMFATTAAAMFLLREDRIPDEIELIEEIDKLSPEILKQIQEEVPVNNVGNGNVAGTIGEPPVNKKKKILRRNGEANVNGI